MEQIQIDRSGPEAAMLWRHNAPQMARDPGRSATPPRIRPSLAPALPHLSAAAAQSGRKALLDLFGALVLIVLLSPLLLAIALAIALDSPGPVIFRQTRGGLGGRRFTMLKFRTMRADAPAAAQTRLGDPRCTHVGSILRRTSLDELPQLFNILRGEMSLVGPRPLVAELHLSADTPHEIALGYALRGQVKPGMTGWAQIHSLRGAIGGDGELQERIKYDLFYIENWCFALDLKILARTPSVVLGGKNAF